MGNPSVQINFKIDKITDIELRKKIALIRDNLENLIQIYNSNDWIKKINMGDIKSIIIRGFNNIEKNYESIMIWQSYLYINLIFVIYLLYIGLETITKASWLFSKAMKASND